MLSSRALWILSSAIVTASLVAVGHAAAPWNRMAIFQKRESQENNEYPVTQENGPWMIYAAAFSSDAQHGNARDREQAVTLVQELRRATSCRPICMRRSSTLPKVRPRTR